jgi:hypothetical protein
MSATPNRPGNQWSAGPPQPPSSLSALGLKSGVTGAEGKGPGGTSGSGTGGQVVSREEFNELRALILSMKDSFQPALPAGLPAPSVSTVAIGKGTTASPAKPSGLLSQLAAATGGVPRTKTSPATPRPVRTVESSPSDEDDDLRNVGFDGKVEEPSVEEVAQAASLLTGPSQVENVKKNHLGKYKIWFRSIIWRDSRNRREADNICRALDAFLDEDVDPNISIGFEILACRLSGLIIMNDGKIKNASKVADRLEFRDEDTMIPHRVLTAAVKTSAMYERVTDSVDQSNKWNNNHKGKGKGKGKCKGKGASGNPIGKGATGTSS